MLTARPTKTLGSHLIHGINRSLNRLNWIWWYSEEPLDVIDPIVFHEIYLPSVSVSEYVLVTVGPHVEARGVPRQAQRTDTLQRLARCDICALRPIAAQCPFAREHSNALLAEAPYQITISDLILIASLGRLRLLQLVSGCD